MLYRNTAFTYDNALALIAFTTLGDLKPAHLLADPLTCTPRPMIVTTMTAALRNCYQAGGLMLPPG